MLARSGNCYWSFYKIYFILNLSRYFKLKQTLHWALTWTVVICVPISKPLPAFQLGLSYAEDLRFLFFSMLRTFHLQFCSLPFTCSSGTFQIVIVNVFSSVSVAMFSPWCFNNVFLIVLHLQTLLKLLLYILVGITSTLCSFHICLWYFFLSKTPV